MAKPSGAAPVSGDSGGAAAADHNGSAAASVQRYSRGLMLKVQCPSFQRGQGVSLAPTCPSRPRAAWRRAGPRLAKGLVAFVVGVVDGRALAQGDRDVT